MAQDTIESTIPFEAEKESRGLKYKLSRFWAVWRRKPMGIFGGILILFFFFVGLAAPVIAPNSPSAFVGPRLSSPSADFPFGTDSLGRDTLSRTIFGAQISIAVGVTATFIGVSLGTIFGIVSGYVGGWIDLVIQRLLEVLASIPGLVLALVMVSALGRANSTSENIFQIAWDLRSLELAIAVNFIFGVMRIVRSAVIKERSLPYIEAAQSIGATTPRILWRHVLPNVAPFVIVAFSTLVGAVILIEASLSFLGYGVASGTPSWGIDLSSRNREYFLVAPWLMAGPGIALSLVVLGYNFLGDAMRDILDPRLRGSR